MNRRSKSIGWSLLALPLGAGSSFLVGSLGGLAAFSIGGQIDSIAIGVAVFVVVGLLAGPFGASFLLTVLIPQGRNWALSCGQLLFGGIFVAGDLFTNMGRVRGIAWVALPAALIAWGAGYAGVRAARRWLPERCRTKRRLGPAEEPTCPACGYVLYFAKGQKCPECGEYFSLRQVDMRRAQWDGYVLRPWPATVENTKSTLHS